MPSTKYALAESEIRYIFRCECKQRVRDEVQGENEESERLIEMKKNEIRLACGFSEAAEIFFEYLVKDSHRISFPSAYLAGKFCFIRGKPLEKGLRAYIRNISRQSNTKKFTSRFQAIYNTIINLMPDGDPKMYPFYLLEEYRKTFGGVNGSIDKFYIMGFLAAAKGTELEANAKGEAEKLEEKMHEAQEYLRERYSRFIL